MNGLHQCQYDSEVEKEHPKFHDFNCDCEPEDDFTPEPYDHCPICGEEWGYEIENGKGHHCDKMFLVDEKKPHFYMIDINNYNDDFLKEIIVWQDMKIRALKDINSINPNEVGLKEW